MPIIEKCKYCGTKFVPLEQSDNVLGRCEGGCPVPLTNGKGYCVNCKEEVYSSELNFY